MSLALLVLGVRYEWTQPWLRLRATHMAPELTLAEPHKWHLFLSHVWDNQDAVASVKRQLQLLLPGVSCFLDVDDLRSIDDLETYVEESAAVLILLGSERYFESRNCLREVAASKARQKPLLLLHDSDPKNNGCPLDVLKAACPDEHRAFVFGEESSSGLRSVIPWHRIKDFQLVSVKQVAEAMLKNYDRESLAADIEHKTLKEKRRVKVLCAQTGKWST